jgi:hypothetical protein
VDIHTSDYTVLFVGTSVLMTLTAHQEVKFRNNENAIEVSLNLK